MARIRSIKPEFPQSESIGNLSRDARLLFILLWTIVDDEGRSRASSRMLASLLYPYDSDAAGLIDGWLSELENGHHIRRYVVDNATYLDIPKWKVHQRIDKPSASKLPPFVETSTNIPRGFQEPSKTEGTLEGKGIGIGIGREEERDKEGKAISAAAPPLQTDQIQIAVAVWNDMAADRGFPTVQRITAPRIKHLTARLAECGGIEGWKFAVAKVRDSPFLRGQNNRGWKADFDFLLQQKSFTKLMEGAYDDRSNHHSNQAQPSATEFIFATLGGGHGEGHPDARHPRPGDPEWPAD
jgi:hypothetical protein